MKKLILLFSMIIFVPLVAISGERMSSEHMFQILDTNHDGELSRSEFDMFEYGSMDRMRMGNNEMEMGEFSAFETEEVVEATGGTQVIDDTWLPSEWSDPY